MLWPTELAQCWLAYGGTGDLCSESRCAMSFDSLAAHYRWMEFVLAGDKLQVCRTAFLGDVHDAKNVLILGEGNGRFLVECRRDLPGSSITCLDASAKMLGLAKHRLESCGLSLKQVEFIHADALQWTPRQGAFDVIVTHFFLDCFSAQQLRRLVANLAEAALPDTEWLLADFCIPRTGPRRYRAQIIHYLMYSFFRVLAKLPARKLTPPDALLRAHHFGLRRRNVSEWGLLHSDRWVRTPQPSSINTG
jgi:ubiquinone/menaquinone biosynthesis C-methylase UbiE